MSPSPQAGAEPEPDFQLFTSLRYDPLLLQSPLNTQHWPLSTPNSTPTTSPFYLLPHHRDRLLHAATHFNWPDAITSISGPSGFSNLLSILSTNIDTNSPTPLRIRIVLTHSGSITVESNPIPPVPLANLFPSRLPPPSSHPPPQELSISPLTGGALHLGATDSLPSDPVKSTPWVIIPDPMPTTPSPYTSYKTTSRDHYNVARERAHIPTFATPREVLLISIDNEKIMIMEGSLTTPFFYRSGKWVTPSSTAGGQIGTTRRWALEHGLCTESTIPLSSLTSGEECWISNGVRGWTWGRIQLSPSA